MCIRLFPSKEFLQVKYIFSSNLFPLYFSYFTLTFTLTFQSTLQGASTKDRRGKEVEKSHRDGTLNYVFLHFNNNSYNLYGKSGLDKGGQYIFNSVSRVICHTVNIQQRPNLTLIGCLC